MAKTRKKDRLDRAMDAAVRSLKKDHPSIGMIARYPLPETPKGEEVAIVVAVGERAKQVGRWLRRARS